MRLSDIPAKLAKVWAAAAGAGTLHAIPVNSQIGVTDGAASLTDGFVPLNAVPRSSGGVPPDIKDFNGILQALSAWIIWLQNGGAIRYDPAYVAANGGYPLGSILQSSVTIGKEYISTVDNNVTDPDGGGAANWNTIGLGIATAAEIIAGIRNDVAVTPEGLHDASSSILGDTGSATLPGGLIIKWGGVRGVLNEGAVALPFASAFPNACFRATVTGINAAYNDHMDVWPQIVGFNTGGITGYVQWTGNRGTTAYLDGVDYIAIGF